MNQDADDSTHESINDEVVVLQSIYEEIEVTEDKSGSISQVRITILPATANNTDTQYVKLQLQFNIPPEYPSAPPDVDFLASRGLSDIQLANLRKAFNKHIHQNQDELVLYSLIEIAKDSLTHNNIPAAPCPICLFAFKKFDDFLKTDCFHHMHSYCMYQYVKNFMEQKKQEILEAKKNIKHIKTNILIDEVPCPVCRASVQFDLNKLKSAPEPINELEAFNCLSIKQKINSMQTIFEKQKLSGGIIDAEAEKNKHLLSSIEQAYAASLEQAVPQSRPLGTSSLSSQNVRHKPNCHKPHSSGNTDSRSLIKLHKNYRQMEFRKYRQPNPKQHTNAAKTSYLQQWEHDQKKRNTNFRSRNSHNVKNIGAISESKSKPMPKDEPSSFH